MKLLHKKAAKDLNYEGIFNFIVDNKELLAYAFYLTLSQTQSHGTHLFCKFKKGKRTVLQETKISCGIIRGEFMMSIDNVYLFKIDYTNKLHIKMKTVRDYIKV